MINRGSIGRAIEALLNGGGRGCCGDKKRRDAGGASRRVLFLGEVA